MPYLNTAQATALAAYVYELRRCVRDDDLRPIVMAMSECIELGIDREQLEILHIEVAREYA